MEIVEKDFKLKPISDDCPQFDLELLYVVKPRGGEARLEFKNAGYGMTLESAIKRIIHYRINCNHREEAISISKYFEEYKKELDNFKNLICPEIL